MCVRVSARAPPTAGPKDGCHCLMPRFMQHDLSSGFTSVSTTTTSTQHRCLGRKSSSGPHNSLATHPHHPPCVKVGHHCHLDPCRLQALQALCCTRRQAPRLGSRIVLVHLLRGAKGRGRGRLGTSSSERVVLSSGHKTDKCHTRKHAAWCRAWHNTNRWYACMAL